LQTVLQTCPLAVADLSEPTVLQSRQQSEQTQKQNDKCDWKPGTIHKWITDNYPQIHLNYQLSIINYQLKFEDFTFLTNSLRPLNHPRVIFVDTANCQKTKFKFLGGK